MGNVNENLGCWHNKQVNEKKINFLPLSSPSFRLSLSKYTINTIMRHFAEAYPQTSGNVQDNTSPSVPWRPWQTTMAEVGEFQRNITNSNRWQPTTRNQLANVQRNHRLAPIPQPGEVSSLDYGHTAVDGPWRSRHSLRKSKVDDIFAQEGRKVYQREWNLAKTSNGTTVYLPTVPKDVNQPAQIGKRPLKSCLKNTYEEIQAFPDKAKGVAETQTSQITKSCLKKTGQESVSSEQQSAVTTALSHSIPLPNIKSVDVQFVTRNNELIGIDSARDYQNQYTFPTGINTIPVPDLRDMNISFALNDGRRMNVRGTPVPPSQIQSNQVQP